MEPSVHVKDSYFGNCNCRGSLIKTSNVLVENSHYNHTSGHCIQANPDGCYWFESGAFQNWTLRNNTFEGCGTNIGDAEDIFVAACSPRWDEVTGLPIGDGSGDNVKVGQPFAGGAIVGNRFIQPDGAHPAIKLFGFAGLLIQDNHIVAPPMAVSTTDPFARVSMGGADPGIMGSLDGFDVETGRDVSPHRAEMFGWVVDRALANTSVSSTVEFEVDGRVVLTAVANLSRPDLVPGACPTPPHGYRVHLPMSAVMTLSTGNHTLAAFALRPGGARWQVSFSPNCVNPLRRSCLLPTDCRCEAPRSPPTPHPPKHTHTTRTHRASSLSVQWLQVWGPSAGTARGVQLIAVHVEGQRLRWRAV